MFGEFQTRARVLAHAGTFRLVLVGYSVALKDVIWVAIAVLNGDGDHVPPQRILVFLIKLYSCSASNYLKHLNSPPFVAAYFEHLHPPIHLVPILSTLTAETMLA